MRRASLTSRMRLPSARAKGTRRSPSGSCTFPSGHGQMRSTS